ncbi:MAG: 4Fe-4S dicluster domain-containing protein [candidate division Zixibacteria bacterium]|nr:4Fe-4S dicluster domain-containing protein [candidate division Zixibacteria bacterium]
MSFNRRGFLRAAALGTTTLIAGKSLAREGDAADCDQALSVLVDTVVCIGCRKCEWACRKAHFDPDAVMTDFDDVSVFKKHRRPDETSYTVVNEYLSPEKPEEKPHQMKVQCMHCVDPACVSACIVGALEKTKNGPVIYDAWECIGCRYCIVACPFQIPAYEYDNALDPQVRKCTFCYDRVVNEGKVPACVETCPNEALTFGTRAELIDLAHSRIKARPDRYTDHVYGKDEVGGTSWMYLAATDFNNTELPELPPDSIPPNTELIQHGIFKWFIPPVALYGLLGLIMYSMDERRDEQEVKHE